MNVPHDYATKDKPHFEQFVNNYQMFIYKGQALMVAAVRRYLFSVPVH